MTTSPQERLKEQVNKVVCETFVCVCLMVVCESVSDGVWVGG